MSGDRDGNNGNGEHPVRPGGDDEPQLDIDTAFAAIVAGWGNDPGGAGAWPEAEDVPLTRDTPAAPELRGTERPPPVERPTQDDADDLVLRPGPAAGPRDVDPEVREAAERAEDEQGYVPPEPPPLPRGDLITRLLWAGTLGGPLFLLLAAVVWRGAPDLLIALAVVAFIGGFVALVVRMPRDRGEDDDDGAVV